MLRFVSNVPCLQVILQHASIKKDPITGYDSQHVPQVSAAFKSGFYRSPSEEIDKLMIRHIAKVRDSGGVMTLHFSLFPPDMKAAQDLADEIGAGILPNFSASAGKNAGRHLASRSASAIPADMKKDLQDAGFDLSATEKQGGQASTEMNALIEDGKAKDAKIAELEAQLKVAQQNAAETPTAPQDAPPASAPAEAASPKKPGRKPAPPTE